MAEIVVKILEGLEGLPERLVEGRIGDHQTKGVRAGAREVTEAEAPAV